MTSSLPEDASLLTDEMLYVAADTRDDTLVMLAHLGKVISKERGVERLLAMFARLSASEWVDGDLCVEIAARGRESTAAFLVSLGMGKMERVLPPLTLAIDFEQLKKRALASRAFAEPLVPMTLPDRLSFAMPEAISRSTSPPEYVSVAKGSLSPLYASVARVDKGVESDAGPGLDRLAALSLDAGWDAHEDAALDAVDEPFADDAANAIDKADKNI